MIRKLLVSAGLCLLAIFSLSSLISQPVAAASSSSYVNGECEDFLGFNSWNCGVDIHDQDSLKSGIWTIAANILKDITVAAAYLVLGYVIYGGYLYIFSAGDAGKVAAGKKTLSQAFIGLAIVLLANVILNTIRIALGADFSQNCAEADNCIGATEMVSNAITWVIGVAGVVSAIFIVYGGIAYMSSAGDPAKLQKAKSVILYALIGLAIVALAEIITVFVTTTINNANSSSTSLINTITIAKGGL